MVSTPLWVTEVRTKIAEFKKKNDTLMGVVGDWYLIAIKHNLTTIYEIEKVLHDSIKNMGNFDERCRTILKIHVAIISPVC